MAVADWVVQARDALRALLVVWLAAASLATRADDGIPAATLPAEAREMLMRLERGGPYRYGRDGAVFGNYERLLPPRNRGYYREYTVDTPGLRHRGSRRLIVGCHRDRAPDRPPSGATFVGFRECEGPAEIYYTEDHYRSFRRVLP